MNRRWIETLLADAGRIEIRHLPSGRSMIVDNADDALAVAGRQADRGSLYSTLNRPGECIAAGQAQAVKDADVDTVVRLPFDFDPVRPSDTASTDAELTSAISARDAFVQAMASRGWPMPAKAISGNGAHAVYRVFLRNDDAARQMLRSLYTGLKHRYSDDEVLFDPTVRNASRIWRLYGTVNRKGTATADRPHRVSAVTLPADWRRVPTKEIERLASEFERRREDASIDASANRVPIVGRGDFATLNVLRWFDAHRHYVGHVGGNVHEVVCPWEAEHTTSGRRDTIVFEADGGWPGFFCHHQHCAGRTIRDVMDLWSDADAFCGRAWRAA